MKNKSGQSGLLILIIILGVIFGVLYSTGKISFDNLSSNTEYDSIKKVKDGVYDYGNEVYLKGKLIIRLGGYSLVDNDGYFIWLGYDYGRPCIEDERDYVEGKTYYVSGKVELFKGDNRVICNQPISSSPIDIPEPEPQTKQTIKYEESEIEGNIDLACQIVMEDAGHKYIKWMYVNDGPSIGCLAERGIFQGTQEELFDKAKEINEKN